MSTEFWYDNFFKWGQRYWIIAIPMRNLAVSLNTGWGKHCIPVMKCVQAFCSHMCPRWRTNSIQLCFSEVVPAHYLASRERFHKFTSCWQVAQLATRPWWWSVGWPFSALPPSRPPAFSLGKHISLLPWQPYSPSPAQILMKRRGSCVLACERHHMLFHKVECDSLLSWNVFNSHGYLSFTFKT